MESTEEEYYNEHFFIPPTFTVDTDSTPNGPYDGPFPLTDPMDTINIYGDDGFPGTFDVIGNFYGPDGIGGFMILGVTTCDSVSSTGLGHLYPITSTCNVANVSIEETDSGLYYFADIQVTAVAGDYDPNVEVPTISGSEDPREQFMISGNAGCTPGYWKQAQHFGNYPFPPAPSDTLYDVGFDPEHGTSEDLTLVQALKLKGGGKNVGQLESGERILLRAATAALLNQESNLVEYGYSGDVVTDTNAAIDAALISGDKQDMLGLAGTFDGLNNPPDGYDADEEGPWCPLGRAPLVD
jgi:hypothetical protein